MSMARLTIVTIVLAVAAFLLVFELLRRRRLREKYAFLWVALAGATVVLAVFPGLLATAAAAVGVATPSNLLFLVSLLVLFGVAVQLSIEVGVLEDQSRRLAEEVGALRMRLDDVDRRTLERAEGTGSEQRAHETPVAPHDRVDDVRARGRADDVDVED